MIDLKTVDYDITKLREHPENPRQITEQRLDDLCKSLKQAPEMLKARPIIALPDGRIIGGNQRYKAAVKLGWTTIPTVIVDLDDTQVRLWMLRDNAPYGDWLEADLAQILKELQDDETIDATLSGFSADSIEDLVDAYKTDTAKGFDDDDEEEVELDEDLDFADHNVIVLCSTTEEQFMALQKLDAMGFKTAVTEGASALPVHDQPDLPWQ
jgi:ParB-like chromosome segregation protein Spo0J